MPVPVLATSTAPTAVNSARWLRRLSIGSYSPGLRGVRAATGVIPCGVIGYFGTNLPGSRGVDRIVLPYGTDASLIVRVPPPHRAPTARVRDADPRSTARRPGRAPSEGGC